MADNYSPYDYSMYSGQGWNPSPTPNVQKVTEAQAGHRNQPISAALMQVLQAAANSAGADVYIISGGQDVSGKGHYHGTRHNLGNAADLRLTVNGRVLDFRNPADQVIFQKFATAAYANGARGIGAGINYMGPATIHVGFTRMDKGFQDEAPLFWTNEDGPPDKDAAVWLSAAQQAGIPLAKENGVLGFNPWKPGSTLPVVSADAVAGAAAPGAPASVDQAPVAAGEAEAPAAAQDTVKGFPGSSQYLSLAYKAADAAGVDRQTFVSLITHESSWDKDAVSPLGADKGGVGLGQIQPGTAKLTEAQLRDPETNLNASANYLAEQYKRFGSWDKAVAAYNAGPAKMQLGMTFGRMVAADAKNMPKGGELAPAIQVAAAPAAPVRDPQEVAAGQRVLRGQTPDTGQLTQAKFTIGDIYAALDKPGAAVPIEAATGQTKTRGAEAPAAPAAVDGGRPIMYGFQGQTSLYAGQKISKDDVTAALKANAEARDFDYVEVPVSGDDTAGQRAWFQAHAKPGDGAAGFSSGANTIDSMNLPKGTTVVVVGGRPNITQRSLEAKGLVATVDKTHSVPALLAAASAPGLPQAKDSAAYPYPRDQQMPQPVGLPQAQPVTETLPEGRYGEERIVQALREGDVEGAKAAYDDVVHRAVTDTTVSPQTALAEVGRYLDAVPSVAPVTAAAVRSNLTRDYDTAGGPTTVVGSPAGGAVSPGSAALGAASFPAAPLDRLDHAAIPYPADVQMPQPRGPASYPDRVPRGPVAYGPSAVPLPVQRPAQPAAAAVPAVTRAVAPAVAPAAAVPTRAPLPAGDAGEIIKGFQRAVGRDATRNNLGVALANFEKNAATIATDNILKGAGKDAAVAAAKAYGTQVMTEVGKYAMNDPATDTAMRLVMTNTPNWITSPELRNGFQQLLSGTGQITEMEQALPGKVQAVADVAGPAVQKAAQYVKSFSNWFGDAPVRTAPTATPAVTNAGYGPAGAAGAVPFTAAAVPSTPSYRSVGGAGVVPMSSPARAVSVPSYRSVGGAGVMPMSSPAPAPSAPEAANVPSLSGGAFAADPVDPSVTGEQQVSHEAAWGALAGPSRLADALAQPPEGDRLGVTHVSDAEAQRMLHPDDMPPAVPPVTPGVKLGPTHHAAGAAGAVPNVYAPATVRGVPLSVIHAALGAGLGFSPYVPQGYGWHAPNFSTGSGGAVFSYKPNLSPGPSGAWGIGQGHGTGYTDVHGNWQATGSYIDSHGDPHPYDMG